MKNHLLLIYMALCALLMLSSCDRRERELNRFQEQLLSQQVKAETLTSEVGSALESGSLDSLRHAAEQDRSILFYVFSSNGIVYWSDNWLSERDVYLTRYDRWELKRFSNAITICRWTRCSVYNVLTVIPIRYDYSFENEQLHNDYIAPFALDYAFDIRQSKPAGSCPIYDKDGNYLFSLNESQPEPAEDTAGSVDPLEKTRLAESFSYPRLMTKGTISYHVVRGDETLPEIAERYHTTVRKLTKLNDISPNAKLTAGQRIKLPSLHHRAYMYIIITLVFFSVLILIGVSGLVRSRGLRNMKLSLKFQYLIVVMLVVAFTYVFFVSISYVKHQYAERQERELVQKTKYIQAQLRDLYFRDFSLSHYNTPGLNIDLRDLSYTYEADIHVYNLNGELIGSSLPQLFSNGVVSTRMTPEVFFSDDHNGRLDSVLLIKETIAQMPYLSAYVELYNGSYVPMGYIEVPYYVSAKERHLAIDEFLARLFPPYLLVMIVSVLSGIFLSRGLTRPLNTLSEGMKKLKIGEHNAHLDYHHKDEVGQLVEQYNQMVDQLEDSAAKLARSERETAWRTMARQIAHEINNPLTPMKLNLQQLQRLRSNDDPRFDEYFQRSTKMLIEQIDNLSRIASSFSTFAKMPEVVTTDIDVAEKLNTVITLFRTNQQEVPVRYIGPDKGVHAKADGEQIAQVFNNLIKNALQAIGDRKDGDIIVVLREEKRTVEISVSDNGCGIPDEIRDKIFVPNFTTKSTGTGLGLAISKNIVEGSAGRIWFETSKKGTTFHISLHK